MKNKKLIKNRDVKHYASTVMAMILLLISSINNICIAQVEKTEISAHIIYEPLHTELGSIVHINLQYGLYVGMNTGNVYGLEHTSYQLGLSYRFKTFYLLVGYHHHSYVGISDGINIDKIHKKSVDVGVITRIDIISFMAITDILNRSTRIGIGINLDL